MVWSAPFGLRGAAQAGGQGPRAGLRRRPAAVRDLWPFLRMGLPSAALLCMDWWSFELLMLLVCVGTRFTELIAKYKQALSFFLLIS